MKITLSDGSIKEYKNSDPEVLDILRHSTAHLMARAVMRFHFPVCINIPLEKCHDFINEIVTF